MYPWWPGPGPGPPSSYRCTRSSTEWEPVGDPASDGAAAGAATSGYGREDAGYPEGAPGSACCAYRAGPAGEAAAAAKRELAVRVAAELAAAEAELAAAEAWNERKQQEVAEAERQLAWQRVRLDPAWRDWAGGLPDQVLEKVASALVAQTEAGWAAQLKERGNSEGYIQQVMARRKRDGNCLFVFARVCKEWRKAQLKVGGPLRTRVCSDVILPGSVALVKWALAEGCPREEYGATMAKEAADYGHLELTKWLCGEGGFAMDKTLMWRAARSGKLELMQWLRGEGCPWDTSTCHTAVVRGHVEVLRWVRENGCPWDAQTCWRAAEELGYTDDFGNLVDYDGNPVDEDDEYGYDEHSYE